MDVMRFPQRPAPPQPGTVYPAKAMALNPCTGLYGDDAAARTLRFWTKSTGFPPCRPFGPIRRRHPANRLRRRSDLPGGADQRAPPPLSRHRLRCPRRPIGGPACFRRQPFNHPLRPGVEEGLEAYKRDITARLAPGRRRAGDRLSAQPGQRRRSPPRLARPLSGRVVREEKAGGLSGLQRVPFAPARNFLEAVQALWFIFAFVRLCGNWPGIGRIDWLLGDYLQKDLAAGVMTKPEAREISPPFSSKAASGSIPARRVRGTPSISEHCSGRSTPPAGR